MFADTRDTLGDEFQKYMHNTIKCKDVKNPWAPDYKEEEEESSQPTKNMTLTGGKC